jgi:hypothetical protein
MARSRCPQPLDELAWIDGQPLRDLQDVVQALRDKSRLALCRAWCVAGDFRAAREVLAQIEDPEAVRRAHRHLVVGLVDAARLEDAVDAASLLEENNWSDDCWWALGVARIRSGEVHRGLADLARVHATARPRPVP